MAKAMKKRKNVESPCKEKIDCTTLVIEQTEYYTTLNKKFENRKVWKAPDPKQVYSHIPGTILKVFTKEGQELKKGDPLIILEAMKMRNEINMPMDGKIIKLNVSEGERIPKGHLIIQID